MIKNIAKNIYSRTLDTKRSAIVDTESKDKSDSVPKSVAGCLVSSSDGYDSMLSFSGLLGKDSGINADLSLQKKRLSLMACRFPDFESINDNLGLIYSSILGGIGAAELHELLKTMEPADLKRSLEYAGKSDPTALGLAAGQGDSELVKILIEAGADVRNAGDDCDPPLAQALKNRQYDVMQSLLQSGATGDLHMALSLYFPKEEEHIEKLMMTLSNAEIDLYIQEYAKELQLVDPNIFF